MKIPATSVRQLWSTGFASMSRSRAPTPSPRPCKRQKLDDTPCEINANPEDLTPATSLRFREGVMLAPMVRSGSLPSRLLALKYGASLVWGPEIVDKAILHARRQVDVTTGVVNYMGAHGTKEMFSTHPVEKPYFIYQIGSADPQLAVQAALTVLPDVSGVDLNCGCPKPFSTHAGMGAALLSNPDLLCSILIALRAALPLHISVSAKIRLLPTQEATLELVKRIVDTGVNAITVHCRTRDMRPRDRALIERLREIVEFVESLGRDVAVIGNGDCISREDASRIRQLTGAHSVMIATAAEANHSCFSPSPLVDAESVLIPNYLRLARHLGNNWGNTKHCVSQLKSPGDGAPGSNARRQELRGLISKARFFDALDEICTPWDGANIMEEIKTIIQARSHEQGSPKLDGIMTPTGRPNPEESALGTPFLLGCFTDPDILLGRQTPSPERPSKPLPVPIE